MCVLQFLVFHIQVSVQALLYLTSKLQILENKPVDMHKSTENFTHMIKQNI